MGKGGYFIPVSGVITLPITGRGPSCSRFPPPFDPHLCKLLNVRFGPEFIVLRQIYVWLVVSTHLKNISQNGNVHQIGVNIKKYLKPPPSMCFRCFNHKT